MRLRVNDRVARRFLAFRRHGVVIVAALTRLLLGFFPRPFGRFGLQLLLRCGELDQAGLAPWIREPSGLADGLRIALSTPHTYQAPTSWSGRVGVVDAIASRLPAMST